MTRIIRKIFVAVLALILIISTVGCGIETETSSSSIDGSDNQTEVSDDLSQTDSTPSSDGVLTVGYKKLSGDFNPFYPGTDGDKAVLELTSVKLLGSDREGNVILNGIEGETISYNGKDYVYNGIADCVIGKNDDGTVNYDITIKENVRFSDDVPMNADDIIFTMYVLADPLYEGSETFRNLPIVGIEEYKADRKSLFDAISQAGRNNRDFDSWNEETQDAFWKDVDVAGVKFVKEIINWLISAGYCSSTDSVSQCMAVWGFEVPESADESMAFDIMLEEYQGNIRRLSEIESAGSTVMDFMQNYDKYSEVVKIGDSVDRIEGIEKTGEYTVRVTMSEYDVNSIYGLQFFVNPLHYYGNSELYDYDNNGFGIEKGNLSGVIAKSEQPMGAGPYRLSDYSEGKAFFEENEHYYSGEAKTKKIIFTETEGDQTALVYSGKIDICSPEIDTVVLETLKTFNSNKEITGNNVTTSLYDKAGYGYIGISAENVKVGESRNSAESKALRMALATLFAKYRQEAIATYYGDTASVIQYPVSSSSWASPRPGDEDYEEAFSVPKQPVDKKWTAFDLNEEEEDDGTLALVVEYLKKAGFTYDEESGKFTDAPEGAKLAYEVLVPAGGIGNHPCYSIFTSAQSQLRKIGITLKVIDVADSNEIWDALDGNKAEIWAAAWGPTVDPDMYEIYHSDNYGMGTGYNYFAITSEALDELINTARESSDRKYRKELYRKCYDVILEWAVEVPVYQRKYATVFRNEKIKMETVPSDITIYYSWINEVSTIELN